MTSQLPDLYYYRPVSRREKPAIITADVIIYGATPTGIAAAIAAQRAGKSAVIAEFSEHVGGVTASGLGATDIGNKAAIGGISREFYRRLGTHYRQEEAWVFEPSAAEKLFLEMLKESQIPVHFQQHLAQVQKNGTHIASLEMEDGSIYRGKMFIDATYEGDLMAMAGVSYHVGREANRVYHETLNGIHFGHPNHNFRAWIDPYKIPGNPESGLLPLVQNVPPGQQGDGDQCIQAYNFRMCLTDKAANRMAFPKPADYDPARFELLLRYLQAASFDVMRLSKQMPNDKSDTNNFGAIGSDHIGENYRWPEASYAEREKIFQDHVAYTAGLFYFLQNDPRIPAHVKEYMALWGLPRDEFPQTHGFPHQLYVREARRMIGQLVMTEHECRGYRVHEDSIGLAAYNMDAHNARRVVLDGRVINEGNVEVPPEKPFPVAYRAILPKAAECANLLVPGCLSSSHIAYGSIRMEPVFMVLGQSAAIAACLALDQNILLHNLSYSALGPALRKADQILAWPEAQNPRRSVGSRMK